MIHLTDHGHLDAVVYAPRARGETVSTSLPMIIVTPAHGTAFDIAGKGIADPSALRNAILLAAHMAAQTRELSS